MAKLSSTILLAALLDVCHDDEEVGIASASFVLVEKRVECGVCGVAASKKRGVTGVRGEEGEVNGWWKRSD